MNAISATIHPAFVTPHVGDPVIAVLFALDAVPLASVTLWALVAPLSTWHVAAVALLGGGICVYWGYLVTGWRRQTQLESQRS